MKKVSFTTALDSHDWGSISLRIVNKPGQITEGLSERCCQKCGIKLIALGSQNLTCGDQLAVRVMES